MSRKLKDWLDEYLHYTEHSEAPDKFHLWTGISAIAGALRRRVWINMGYFEWTPNFYIFFVAPPGVVSKSTTAAIGMDLLRELSYIHFGAQVTTWQALVEALGNSREDFPTPDGMFEPQCALTIVASELGTFLDPQNREMIDVLVDLWDGKRADWTKATKKDGVELVANPWINLLGCTTPSWVADNFNGYFTGGGFASRSIFVFAEEKRRLVAYPQRHIPEGFQNRRNDLIHDLTEISNLLGEYRLTETAFEWGEDWYKRHHDSRHEHIPSDKFKAYLARKQTHLHKLAMVRAASLGDELTITHEDLKWAEQKISDLEPDMPKVFDQLTLNERMSLHSEVLALLRSAAGTMPKAQLYRHFIKSVSATEFNEILSSMINADLIVEYSKKHPTQDGQMFVIELLDFGLEKKETA